MKIKSSLAFSVLIVLGGCNSPKPEDRYLGTEHWVATDTSEETINYLYDLGSVRRTEGKVIVNVRRNDDVDFELSEKNRQRQQAGLPLYLSTSMVMVIDCQKRTFSASSLFADYSDGSDVSQPDVKSRVIRPNSAIEEIHSKLCLSRSV
jgi:hypothetical protein